MPDRLTSILMASNSSKYVRSTVAKNFAVGTRCQNEIVKGSPRLVLNIPKSFWRLGSEFSGSRHHPPLSPSSQPTILSPEATPHQSHSHNSFSQQFEKSHDTTFHPSRPVNGQSIRSPRPGNYSPWNKSFLTKRQWLPGWAPGA